jgi:hypothetical protein
MKNIFSTFKPSILAYTLTTVVFGTLAIAPSASAFTFSANNDTVGIGSTDINKSFDIVFDGNVATQDVDELSSEATFKFLGFTTIGTGSSAKTEARFDISLTNTSNSGIISRTSALGLNVSRSLLGTGSAGGNGNTRATGLFSNDRSGAFPNEFGNVDVCFTTGNTCQGGTNGGVDNNPATSILNTGNFIAILAFQGAIDSFNLNNFGVRYQSISGNGFNGASGTGKGKVKRKVPEPAMGAALGFFAISAFGLRKKNKKLVSQN